MLLDRNRVAMYLTALDPAFPRCDFRSVLRRSGKKKGRKRFIVADDDEEEGDQPKQEKVVFSKEERRSSIYFPPLARSLSLLFALSLFHFCAWHPVRSEP